MTRNFALRDRGVHGYFFVTRTDGLLHGGVSPPPGLHAANMCFTIRSSMEWNVMTAIRPLGAKMLPAALSFGQRPQFIVDLQCAKLGTCASPDGSSRA